MRLPLYQVDAFTSRLFGGNPAAICPLENWLPDALLQSIAIETNLAETAYFVKEADGYRLRWFTPAVEVDLSSTENPTNIKLHRSPVGCLLCFPARLCFHGFGNALGFPA